MNKIPCAVIKDLLPSYVDGLTSPESDELIKEHIAECESCRIALENMKKPEGEEALDTPGETKEIDFLKKNKKRNRTIVCASIAGALVLIGVIVFVRFYLVGNRMPLEATTLQTTLQDDVLILSGTVTDSALGLTNPTIIQKDGKTSIYLNEVLYSPASDSTFKVVLTDANEIQVVEINDRPVWVDGQRISVMVSSIYDTRHDYMGDPSANNRTANALHMAEIFGPFENELLSQEQPYTWKIKLKEEIPSDRLEYLENKMRGMSYIMLGVIGNLDAVTFEYSSDGQSKSQTVYASEATEFLQKDIKQCKDHIEVLQCLYDNLNY